MKLSIHVGSTSQTVNVFIQDSSSTTGAGLSGLVFNTASLTAYYALPKAASVQITLATLAAITTAYSSGGFKEVDATNMKGWYRLDLPDAAIASGRFVSIHLQGAANMAPCPIEIELTGWDNQDAVHGGMSSLPNTACTTNASLLTSGAGTDQLSVTTGRVDVGKALGTAVTLDSNNVLNVSTKYVGGTLQTARDLGTSVLLSSGTGTGQISLSSGAVLLQATQTGVTIPNVTTVGSVTGAVGSVTGAVGSVTGAVGSVTAAVSLSTADSPVIVSGTASAGAAGTITLAGASTTANIYNGCLVKTTGGTGSGQVRTITAYSTGRVATVDYNWTTTPDNTTTFAVLATDNAALNSSLQTTAASVQGNVTGSVASVTGAVGSVTGAVGSVTGSVGSVTGAVGSISGVTFPTNFSSFSIDASGRVDIAKIKGTASAGTAGYVGLDWSAINAPTTTVGLSGTTISTSQAVASVSGAVGSVTGAVGSVTGSVASVTGAVGSVTGAVGSVTGNVGGNVVGSVASVTAAVTLSAGDSPVLQSGTAQAGAASTITLASGASATDSLYNGCVVKITSGSGAGQARTITGYVGSTKVATVDYAWTTNPSSSSVYAVLATDNHALNSSLQVTAASVQGNVTGSVASVTGAVGSVTGSVGSVTGAVGSVTGNVGGNVVGTVASVVGAVGSISGVTFPTNFSSFSIDASGRVDVAKIKGTASAGAAGYVGLDWATINAPTTTQGLTGTTISSSQAVASVSGAVGSVTGAVGSVTGLTTATITTAVWTDLLSTSDFSTVGSIGKLLKDDINVALSTLSTYAGGDTSGTTTLLSRLTSTRAGLLDNLDAAISTRSTFAGGAVASVTGAVGSVTGNVGGNVVGTVASVVGAVGSVTGNVGGNVVGSVASVTAAVTLSINDSPAIVSGTASAGGASTITLAGASATDSYYVGCFVKTTGGTGPGQVRTITGYVGSTKVATVDRAWTTNPDSTTTFAVLATDHEALDSSLRVTAGTVSDKTGYSLTQTFPTNFATLAIDASGRVDVGKILGTASAGVAGYVGIDWSHVNAPTTTVGLTGTTIATSQAVASVSGAVGSVTGAVGSVTGAVGSVTGNVGGNVVGSVGSLTTNNDKTGYSLTVTPPTAATIATTVWTDLLAGSDFSTASSIGKLLKDDIDATVSSRSTYAGGDTSGTTTLLARLTSTRAGLLDNLDAAVSTRMATFTVPTNFADLAITATTGRIDVGKILGTTSTGAAGYVGLDWGQVTNKTTTNVLSGTTISTSQAVASVSGAVGSVTGNVGGNLIGTIGGYASGQDPATLVLDVAASSHNTSLTIGNKINAAASAGDPWSTAVPGSYGAGTAGAVLGNLSAAADPWGITLPGSYGAGTAGQIIGNNLNATVSSRLASASYTAPPTTAANATAVWQDLLSGSDFSTVGSVGKLLKDDINVALSTLSTYAGADTAGTTTLLGRLTSTRAGNLDNLDAAVSTRLATSGYTAPPSAAIVATTVWQDLTSSSDFTTNSSIGKLLVTDIDATISSRSTYAGGDTAGTTTLLSRLTSTRAGLLDNLDAAISTRSTYAGADTSGTTTLLARLTSTRAGLLDNLDAAISTRSTFAGGAVASVTAAVTVGGYSSGQSPATLVLDAVAASHTTALTIGAKISAAASAGDPWSTDLPGSYGPGTAGDILGNFTGGGPAVDAHGYVTLAPAGLDQILLETDLNARQALQGMAAAALGKIAGLGSNIVIVSAAGVDATRRLTATVDSVGNRTVELTLSA